MAITVYTLTRTSIQLEEHPLATAGAEGSVHRVKSSPKFPNHCAKIYHPKKRNDARKQKIEFMVNNKPPILTTPNYIICFPLEMIYNNKNIFIGFIMPLAFPGSEKLYELTTTKIATKLKPNWGKFERTSRDGIEKRLKVCVNIARAIHDIHQAKMYAIVDYKPQNILITSEGKISITDVDSFQISKNGKVLHYSEVATPEYTPPESVRLNPSKAFIPESWDRFSLAVSFYEILFGIHPFASTCDGQYGNVTTIGEKIQKGLFVHGSKKSYLTVIPPIHNNFLNLPLSVRGLFIKAFEDGHTNPNSRPSSEDWGKAIYSELVTNTGIKANSTTIQQKNTVSTTASGHYKPNPKTVTTATTKQKLAGTITKKENYMVWKILTLIFASVAIGFFIKSNSNKAEVDDLKNKILNYESANSNLLSQRDQAQANQANNESNYKIQISELQNNIDSIGQKYPISLNDITFNNVKQNMEVIGAEEIHNFSKNELQYIQPVIKFNSNLLNIATIKIYYKFYDPNGKILSVQNSPYNYTWNKDVIVSGDYTKNSTEKLVAIGIDCPNSCVTGKYRVEIWCNSIMIGESYFNINDY